MTKFINKNNKKESVKTVFTKVIYSDGVSKLPLFKPEQYDFVELILEKSNKYEALFKAYEKDSDNFVLYFGIAGDEFNQ